MLDPHSDLRLVVTNGSRVEPSGSAEKIGWFGRRYWIALRFCVSRPNPIFGGNEEPIGADHEVELVPTGRAAARKLAVDEMAQVPAPEELAGEGTRRLKV